MRLHLRPLYLPDLTARAADASREARWDEAIGWSTLGLIESMRQGARGCAVEYLNVLGAVEFERGAMEMAERYFERALGVARNAGLETGAAAALVNLGAVANVRGRFDRALSCYRRGRWAYHRGGNLDGEARALNNLGMVFADLGRWPAAVRCYKSARRRALEGDDEALVGIVALNATEVFLATGDLKSATESCDEAIAILRDRDPLAAAEAHRFYGQIYERRGDSERAEAHLGLAARRSRDLGAPLTEAEALRELGLLHLTLGRHRSALECFGRSLKLFRVLEAQRDLSVTRLRVDDLEKVVVRIVEQLAREVETHDLYLYGHSARVARYATAIACDLGFGPDDMKGILVAGYLHDIGKLQIDAALLNKEGRLTEEEMDEIRKHPVLGLDHLVRFELPWDVEAAVRGHHERYDGTGYPDGRAGRAIPIGARILLVADVFDALTTARSYRQPWNREQALTYLEMSAGSLSDPEITSVFLEIAWRESLGPDDVDSIPSEQLTRPDELAARFAALPRPESWDRLDEEFARV